MLFNFYTFFSKFAINADYERDVLNVSVMCHYPITLASIFSSCTSIAQFIASWLILPSSL